MLCYRAQPSPRGVSLPQTLQSQLRPHSVNGQRSNHLNKCSQRSKWSQSTFKSQCGMDQISAAIRSEPGSGVTLARNAYFLTYRLADLGCSSNIETSLRAKYPSSQRSMGKNQRGQRSNCRKEPAKVLIHGRSCDYRVYGSDTPLLTLSVLKCTANS